MLYGSRGVCLVCLPIAIDWVSLILVPSSFMMSRTGKEPKNGFGLESECLIGSHSKNESLTSSNGCLANTNSKRINLKQCNK